jgi:hypothetical protein
LVWFDPPTAPQVFIAQMLLSGEGDTLLAIQSLIGAVGMTAFTYFLPYAFLLALSPTKLSRLRSCWCVANIAIGIVVMAGGFWSSITDLASASAGLFNGKCKLPNAYATDNPDDPCYESGIPVFAIDSLPHR